VPEWKHYLIGISSGLDWKEELLELEGFACRNNFFFKDN
jgi:hypothetical protein